MSTTSIRSVRARDLCVQPPPAVFVIMACVYNHRPLSWSHGVDSGCVAERKGLLAVEDG